MSEKTHPEICRAEMELGPVWDARIDLQTLVGILGAGIYLIHREDGDNDEKADILTALIAVQEKIAECADGLDDAIKGMKIVKEASA